MSRRGAGGRDIAERSLRGGHGVHFARDDAQTTQPPLYIGSIRGIRGDHILQLRTSSLTFFKFSFSKLSHSNAAAQADNISSSLSIRYSNRDAIRAA